MFDAKDVATSVEFRLGTRGRQDAFDGMLKTILDAVE